MARRKTKRLGKLVLTALAVALFSTLPMCTIRAFATADTTWQNDYRYETRGTDIILSQYQGSGGDIVVPAEAVIGGVTYHTVINSDYAVGHLYFTEDNITSFSVEPGVSATSLTQLFAKSFYHESAEDDRTMLTRVDLSNLDTSACTNMNSMFMGCVGLTSLDLSSLDVSANENFGNMFGNCTNLTSIDMTGWDTSSATGMVKMFYKCHKLENLDVSFFDTSKCINMWEMFSECHSLTSLDVSRWDTSSFEQPFHLFYYCDGLTSLDVSNWDMSHAVNLSWMFNCCYGLTELDLSKWNVSASATNLSGLFGNCTNLVKVNVSGWDTSNVLYTEGLVEDCMNLESLDLSDWDLSSLAENGGRDMFTNTISLTTLDTPKNVGREIALTTQSRFGGTYCYTDPAGNEYTALPKNSNASVHLTRALSGGEMTRKFIARLYRVFLNRTAEQWELDSWTEQMVDDGLTERLTAGEVAAGFIFSPEFQNRNLCNSHYLDYLYSGLFDRPADEEGKAGWTELMDSGYSRERVAQGFLTSPEFQNLCNSYGVDCGTGLTDIPAYGTIQKRHCTIAGCPEESPAVNMVVSLYLTTLGRAPREDEVDFWVEHLGIHDVTGRVLVNSFVNGQEYQNIGRSNEEYVRDLYHAIFNREPDVDGYNGWVKHLNEDGFTREQVLNGFTVSQEFLNQCNHAGIEVGAEL
ncbi:MAG: DUF4214 domain-containing protein [Lachnospiraceae bacterium]|nr:DUF4214 domain-containing protein [Lachnospiraceae bacterium]